MRAADLQSQTVPSGGGTGDTRQTASDTNVNNEPEVMNTPQQETEVSTGMQQDNILNDFSLEITAKDVESFRQAVPALAQKSSVSVTFLPGETMEARLQAIAQVAASNMLPMPHISARRIQSEEELHQYVQSATSQSHVKRCFVIAGDPPVAEGPYSDSLTVIKTGVFEKNGIEVVGIGGHPEGHPNMSIEECFAAVDAKCTEINTRGMQPLIVTQFSFDADAVLSWLIELRKRGISAPVRLGIPGPAGIKTLLRFAKICGVQASSSVVKKYGFSLTQLMGTAGPDKLVDTYKKQLTDQHGDVKMHFYPFGGLERTLQWVDDYRK